MGIWDAGNNPYPGTPPPAPGIFEQFTVLNNSGQDIQPGHLHVDGPGGALDQDIALLQPGPAILFYAKSHPKLDAVNAVYDLTVGGVHHNKAYAAPNGRTIVSMQVIVPTSGVPQGFVWTMDTATGALHQDPM